MNFNIFIFREKKNLWKHNIYIFFSKFFSSLKNNNINFKQKIIPLEIKLKKKEKVILFKQKKNIIFLKSFCVLNLMMEKNFAILLNF